MRVEDRGNIFDLYCTEYDKWYEKNKFAYLSELEALKKVLPKKGRGLEIGAGTARFTKPLNIWVGIDLSKNMAKIAKERGVRIIVSRAEELPFKDSIFDYVAIIFTLCFVDEPLKMLREAKRVLKRRGKIIIGIIDKESFLGKAYQIKKSIFYSRAKFFSVKEVTDILQTMGFDRFSYYQTIFNFPQEIKNIQKPQKGFGKGAFVAISAELII